MKDIEVLTLYEYQMRMKAYRLAQVDREYEMHLQAWLNHAVTATKEQGKKQVPVYKNFKEFFDYEKRLKEVEKELNGQKQAKFTPHQRRLAQMAALVNQGKGGEHG